MNLLAGSTGFLGNEILKELSSTKNKTIAICRRDIDYLPVDAEQLIVDFNKLSELDLPKMDNLFLSLGYPLYFHNVMGVMNENLKNNLFLVDFTYQLEIAKRAKDAGAKNISIISKICKTKKIELLIESNMSPNEFFYLKKKVKSDNFYFLFDTGNRVLLKRNLVTDIYKFNNEIKHVHLKDKNLKDKNVIFGNGEVKFVPIFKALKKINYKGSFTIESQRGKDIINQATQNYIFFKKLINQYLNK